MTPESGFNSDSSCRDERDGTNLRCASFDRLFRFSHGTSHWSWLGKEVHSG